MASTRAFTSSSSISLPLRRRIPLPSISPRSSSSVSISPLQRISGFNSNQSWLLRVASSENSHVASVSGSLPMRSEKPSPCRRDVSFGNSFSSLSVESSISPGAGAVPNASRPNMSYRICSSRDWERRSSLRKHQPPGFATAISIDRLHMSPRVVSSFFPSRFTSRFRKSEEEVMERMMAGRAVGLVSSRSAKAVSITARTLFLVLIWAER